MISRNFRSIRYNCNRVIVSHIVYHIHIRRLRHHHQYRRTFHRQPLLMNIIYNNRYENLVY